MLVVDDYESGRYAKAHVLREAGFRVLEAATGKQALQIVAAEQPSLVLLDIKLPDIDGFAVCAAIKGDPDTARIMVLQVSAYFTSTRDQISGLDGGADAYIPGDIEPGLLVSTVRALLRTGSAEQALYEREKRLKLMEALERSERELRAVTAALLTAQEDERRRIAREMHDDFAQRLSVLEFSLTNLRSRSPALQSELKAITTQVQALSRDICDLSYNLHPSTLEDLGLDVALRRLCEDFERATNAAIRFAGAATGSRVPVTTATVFYRIAQEALHNVARHAGDARVTVALEEDAGQWRLTIEDDGCGFDPSLVRSKPALGLASMQERARLEGGGVEVHSVPGQGTRVRAWIPCRVEKQLVSAD